MHPAIARRVGRGVPQWEQLQTHLPTSCKSTTGGASWASVWLVSEIEHRCSKLAVLEWQQCGGIWGSNIRRGAHTSTSHSATFDKTSHGGAEHYLMGEEEGSAKPHCSVVRDVYYPEMREFPNFGSTDCRGWAVLGWPKLSRERGKSARIGAKTVRAVGALSETSSRQAAPRTPPSRPH